VFRSNETTASGGSGVSSSALVYTKQKRTILTRATTQAKPGLTKGDGICLRIVCHGTAEDAATGEGAG
jgi:hypothetical protein